ncbi:hypothetical protein LRS06_00600 [Hymenobacter sp. J193]|uniref:hypothetical protein n=1 Tax=Hymenobacter sp. J193 TaxID=2898429 RepID=UPI002150FF33|nr:hypothetical protein [Hymenobacter sp. J193]MCR5886292.1 hypothetical protein [Hymenobacter sp. J193]
MESNLLNTFSNICQVLNKCSVEYLIVGGTAVALHGYFRYTTISSGAVAEKPDFDFWYNPSYTNYFNLLNALEELGQDVAAFKSEQAPNPKKSFFKYEFEDFTIDFLPELKAPLRFASAFANREVMHLAGIDVAFIGYSDLMTDKAASARPKDLTDIQELEDRNRTQED